MRYICIHGHFYQPPRENAWTGRVDKQDSAAPYHDWNARITAECYGPNEHARVLNNKKEITDLINNYSYISFNFGPTLLSWLEEKEPAVYQAVLDADKESIKRFGGHGSALAQVYNHIIMPLATKEEKEIQVVWGIKDFEKRFNRAPEGMWLAEAAVDTETLEVLAAHGIKFTVLAPGSCQKIRKIGDKKFIETKNAGVDPKRPYLCNLPSGKTITLFFYDGPISQSIAFADTLNSGENFYNRLMSAFTGEADNQLVHIATDGETYGHHHKFADLALSYCIKNIQDSNQAKLTIYGEYLEKFPPKYEAVINDNTSWSCFHGVERWRSDCGCNSGHAGWNQKWRGPLRDALDFVREETHKTFDKTAAELFRDSWNARVDYIDVVFAKYDTAKTAELLNKHATEQGKQQATRSLRALEMMLQAQLMYTSCGWFFDEISGIETVQVMQYAARAIELNTALGGENIENAFIEKLRLAPSNIADLQNGGNIYELYVKPSFFNPSKAALHYAMAVSYAEKTTSIFNYTVETEFEQTLEVAGEKVYIGTAVFTDTEIEERTKRSFVLIGAGKHRLICFVGENLPGNADKIKEIVSTDSLIDITDALAPALPNIYRINDLVRDSQVKIIDTIMNDILQKTKESFSSIFDKQYPLLRELKYIGMDLPVPFMRVAEFVFTNDIKDAIEKDNMDDAQVEEILEDAKSMSVPLNNDSLSIDATRKLEALSKRFLDKPNRDTGAEIIRFLKDMETLPFKPGIFKTQENVFNGIRKLSPDEKDAPYVRVLKKKLMIAL